MRGHRQLGVGVAGEQLGAQLEQLAPPLVDLQAGVGGLGHSRARYSVRSCSPRARRVRRRCAAGSPRRRCSPPRSRPGPLHAAPRQPGASSSRTPAGARCSPRPRGGAGPPAARLPHRGGVVPRHAGARAGARAGWAATLATNDPAGRRIAVRLAPGAEGVIALRGRGHGRRGVRPRASRFARPPRRALPRLRRALQRGGPARRRGGELRGRGAVRGGRARRDAGLRARVGLPPARRRHLLPDAWLLSTAGYGVLVDNTETSYFRLGRAARAGLERRGEAPRLGLRVFAGPRPADVLRAAHRAGSAGSRRCRRPFVLRPLVPADGRRRGRRAREAAAPRRAALGGADLHALPALRRAGGARATRSARGSPASTTPAWRSPPTSTR